MHIARTLDRWAYRPAFVENAAIAFGGIGALIVMLAKLAGVSP